MTNWARAFNPQTKEYVKFLVTEPENLTREALYAKERALIADVKEELRLGRRCQIYPPIRAKGTSRFDSRPCCGRRVSGSRSYARLFQPTSERIGTTGS